MFIRFWKNFIYKDTFKKVLFTLFILGIYRVISMIPLPGVDINQIILYISSESTSQTSDIFSIGGIERFGLLASGITPYISASILTQVLSSSVGIDSFKKLKKDKNLGASELNQWTKYFTVFIGIIQGIFTMNLLMKIRFGGFSVFLISSDTLIYILGIFGLLAGNFITIWLSNLISRIGIGGSGSAVIMLSNILIGNAGTKIFYLYKDGILNMRHISILGVSILFFISFIVFVESSLYKIRVRHLGVSENPDIEYLRFKINNAGVMTAIISSYFAYFPEFIKVILDKIGSFTESYTKIVSYLDYGTPIYYIFFGTLILFITISHTEIVLDPKDVSEQLQEHNVIVIDTRPGIDTEKKLRSILSFLNILAGFYLIFICICSEIFCNYFNFYVGANVLNISGTSFLLAVTTAKSVFLGVVHYNYRAETSKIKSPNEEEIVNQKIIDNFNKS